MILSVVEADRDEQKGKEESMSRSVRFHEFGGPEVLKIEDVVVPDPGPKQVRLRIKAIGLNRSEVLTRSGKAASKVTLPPLRLC
jgi:NADPH:quinone reductase-like Zn-dependent oxidoreductase